MTEPETSIAALTIQLFGPMQVRVQGQPLPPLRSRAMLWLLAILTLRHNRPVEREWLAGTLWPDSDQSQAFTNLRTVISGLKSALGGEGGRLQSPNRHTLFLDLTDADVDVLQFDAALARKTLSALEQAVGLYRGPLLEGCNEEWVLQERAVRKQDCLQALQKLGDAALTGGDYEKAVGYYQHAVGMAPWGEVARRGWMEALARSGDINAALQVYREFVEVLRSDPKAVPDEQTSALYQRLRTEARQKVGTYAVVTAPAVAVPVVQGYLPHPLTDLVGREDERIEVATLLRRSRLVTLTGLGGIGKTRLAREVAGAVVGEYADGVWLVALESLNEGRRVIQQVASVLGLKEERGRTPLQRVTEHLRQKRLLLVLDNCEHLLEASAQAVGHLLQECAELRILATSREAMGIADETVWSVPALAVPDIEHLPQGQAALVRVLRGYESVQLFVERARAVRESFALSGGNARLVAQVCCQLEGIPLAIELAAARVRAMSVDQIASRLNDHLGLLTGGSRTAQSRQQTLRATLDWSYDLLTEAERALLKRLSVFAGGWTLEAAEAICCADGAVGIREWAVGKTAEAPPLTTAHSLLPDEVLDLLTSLMDKSLVLFEEREPADGRYRLLEMVRQYAAASLQASGESEQVKCKHRDWFVALAEAEEPRLRTAEQELGLRRLETEYENLRSALAWCRAEENGAQAGLCLAGALGRFWAVRGYLTEGRRYLADALGREGAAGRTPERARALNGAGVLAYRQGDYPEARSLYGESLGIKRELGDRQGVAAALNNLGAVAKDQGDYASARVLFEESLAIQRELGDQQGVAGSLSNLGTVAFDQGDDAAARVLYEKALTLNREFDNRVWVAINLANLGILAHRQGDYAAARALFEESLAIRRELGDRHGIAYSLNNLGSAANKQGDPASARILHEESLAIRRELGDRRGIAESLGNLGNVAINQGDYASARILNEESLAIRRELESRLGIAVSLESFANLALKAGSGERAARLWGAASALRESIGSHLPPNEQEDRERDMGAVRAAIGEKALAAMWAEGRALTWEQAVAYALKQDQSSSNGQAEETLA
jgi:predicted ATPase/DNA-binding SARP family transcriptional activator/Tfp pilus assembly protein PilF